MRRSNQEFVLRGKAVKAQGYGTAHVAGAEDGDFTHTSCRG